MVSATPSVAERVRAVQDYSPRVNKAWGLPIDNKLDDEDLRVSKTTRLRGFTSSHGVRNFLNVPYARVPTRFLPSDLIHLDQVSGTFECRYYGPRCPQGADLPHWLMDHLQEKLGITQRMSETDCLHLNIYAPPTTVASPPCGFPVLAYIHGGACSNGDNLTEFDGNHLVKRSIALGKPVIVVTISYRLGFFGFFASRELLDEQRAAGREPVMNLGFDDQRNALRFVQKHIALFGGDPAMVTLSGESAGGMSVWWAIKSQAAGLFRQAIIQSMPPGMIGKMEDSQKLFDSIVADLGIAADAPALVKVAALRSLTAAALIKYWDGAPFRPVVDPGWLVAPSSSDTPYASMEYWTDTPSWLSHVVIGCTRDEASLFTTIACPDITWDEARDIISSSGLEPRIADCVLASPVFTSARSAIAGFTAVATDASFAGKTFEAAKLLVKGHASVFVYEIDTVDPYPTPLQGFAWHSFGLPLLFHLPPVLAYTELAETSLRMTATYLDYFHGAPAWEEFSVGNRFLSFDGANTGLRTLESRADKVVTFESAEDQQSFYAAGFMLITAMLQKANS